MKILSTHILSRWKSVNKSAKSTKDGHRWKFCWSKCVDEIVDKSTVDEIVDKSAVDTIVSTKVYYV